MTHDGALLKNGKLMCLFFPFLFKILCFRSSPCYFGERWPDLQFDFPNVNLKGNKNIFEHSNSRNGAVWKKYVKLSNLCANLNTRSAFFTCLSSFFQSSKEAWSIYLKKYVERLPSRKVTTVKKFPLSKKFIWLRTDIHPWWHVILCVQDTCLRHEKIFWKDLKLQGCKICIEDTGRCSLVLYKHKKITVATIFCKVAWLFWMFRKSKNIEKNFLRQSWIMIN